MRSQIFIRVALSFFSCGALIGAVSGHAQGTSAAPAPAAAPASAQKILSKNPDYLKLLNPPVGDDLLRAYSESYQKKAAEIEAKLADITDEKVRSQTREDEWAKVTKRERLQFQYEADVALNNARASFSQSHRDAWFEVGHGTYDESAAAYVVRAVPSAPMTMNFMAPMSRAALNQVYEKFHQIAAPEIEQKARAYVTESGANSNCARNPDLCFQLKSNEIEQGLRPSRVVVVAQGDLEQQKIDRLLIVDYETEGILLELDPHVPILNPVTWRFSIGKVLPPPVDPEPPAAAVQPAPAAPVVESEKGSGAEPAPNAPNLPAGPPARIAVPANVEAASIISRTKPVYPPEARAKMIHGDVVLRAIIDKEGKISELRVLDGDETLAKAAVDAVRQWRYKPMLSDGQPTEVETTVTVTFSLAE
ncbi:MAG: energy transducer TonB [Acidobacteriia bacterium]|nr:energy transducer TonB [Terriglobia bacterium]